jgi:hypothetical protein
MSQEWVKVEDGLPPMERPVWMLLPDSDQPIIGCRTDDGEGWVWGRCYSLVDCYWNPATRGWEAENCEVDDDYQPTHWAYLINPPEVQP